MVLHPIRVLETPTIDVIVGILAEHRWKHLVQIGQLLPSQYQLLIFAWYTKISSRNERTWEPMMRTQFGTNYNCGGSGCSARKPTMPSIVEFLFSAKSTQSHFLRTSE